MGTFLPGTGWTGREYVRFLTHEVEMPAFRGRCFLFRKRNVYIFVWVTWAKWTVYPVVVKIGLDSKCYPPCNRSCAPRHFKVSSWVGQWSCSQPEPWVGWSFLTWPPRLGGGVGLFSLPSAQPLILNLVHHWLMFYEQTIPEGILESQNIFWTPELLIIAGFALGFSKNHTIVKSKPSAEMGPKAQTALSSQSSPQCCGWNR